MNSDYKDTGTIRVYLLNQATQEYSSWLEEQIFTDDTLFQELLVAEDELIDQYLRDELTPTERQSFETHFLAAPERRQKLRFSRALRKYVDCAGASEVEETEVAENVSVREPDLRRPTAKKDFFSFLPFKNPIVSSSFAAAMLLIVGGLSLVAYNNWRQQTPQQPGNIYVATLTPGLTRDLGGGQSRIEIPPNAGVVELQLEVGSNPYQSYRATLRPADSGAENLTINDLKSADLDGRHIVSLKLPARLFARGDYDLKLSGLDSAGEAEDLGSYTFRVVK